MSNAEAVTGPWAQLAAAARRVSMDVWSALSLLAVLLWLLAPIGVASFVVFAVVAAPIAALGWFRPRPPAATIAGLEMTSRPPSEGEPGCYWIETRPGIYKIGMTTLGILRINQHMAAARTISDTAIKLRWWTPCPVGVAPRQLEKRLHRQFRATRIRVRGAGTELFRRDPGSQLDLWLTETETERR